MTAAELIAACRAAGVALSREGDRVRARPAGALPDELRAAVVGRRDEVLAALAAAGKPSEHCTWCDLPIDSGPVAMACHVNGECQAARERQAAADGTVTTWPAPICAECSTRAATAYLAMDPGQGDSPWFLCASCWRRGP